jgi:hypothetical protein
MWREILQFLKSSLPRALKFLEAAGFDVEVVELTFSCHFFLNMIVGENDNQRL